MTAVISGIFPALTTPFQGGKLAVEGLKANIEKFERFDLAGYLVLGSTGEGVLMSEGERIRALEAVRSSASGTKMIIAGTGMQSTRATVQFTNLAAETGADYALVVTPFYFKKQMDARTLELYYREVAEQSRLPVLMYNVPKFTGIDLPLETVLSLAEHPNIAGLKESSGDIAFISELLKGCPPGFTILQGAGSVLFPSLVLGARGGILALSNMAPAETVEIYKGVQAGDLERARDLQMRLVTLNRMIVNGYGVPGIKCALDLLGYLGGEPLPPLQPVRQEVREAITGLLQEAGLL